MLIAFVLHFLLTTNKQTYIRRFPQVIDFKANGLYEITPATGNPLNSVTVDLVLQNLFEEEELEEEDSDVDSDAYEGDESESDDDED